MCRTKIVIEAASPWVRLAAFRVVAWVMLGIATLGSWPDRLAGHSNEANVSACALRALRQQAYCSLKALQYGLGHQELGENEPKSELVLTVQGRSRASRPCLLGRRDRSPTIVVKPLRELPQAIRVTIPRRLYS